MISVIALFDKPPPAIRSSAARPVGKTVVGGVERWGKRSASNFRRSTMEFAPAMAEAWHRPSTCSSEHFEQTKRCAWRFAPYRSEEHTSELQSRFGISYAVFCLKKKKSTYTYWPTLAPLANPRAFLTCPAP